MKPSVLITGASGMLGRNLIDHPLAANYIILSPGRDKVDIKNYNEVLDYLAEFRPDVIIHAAGRVGGIQANIQYPVEFLVDNLDMGRNILLAAREAGIQRVLNIASSCMYPREAVNPLDEKLILTGELEQTNEGYALAKILIARLADYLVREDPSHYFKTIVPCNLYGKYDKFLPQHSHLIAAIIDKVYKARQSGLDEIEIWGDGTARREFMFAADLADFIWRHLDRIHELPQLLNVGYGTDYSVNDYYQLVSAALNFNGQFTYNMKRPVGMKQKLMSSNRVTALGWKPITTLKQGIAKTIDYYVSIYG